MAKKVTRAMKVEMFNAGKAAARAGYERIAFGDIAFCDAVEGLRHEEQKKLIGAWYEGFDSLKGK